ncbi:glycosyltransferase [Brachyspira hyodysenteriae]|uniref:glycosyltransferase n=1 Tax=Brachyspira hyodysenteriae TaxID=159 RepID=UPI00063DB460|nr:glycosyltransferase [Brachyspira hyodysenteriae]AUJ49890.1 glycosyl transferase family 2 [Brachyspira hyodysenteriae]KLI21479.1 glycosyl transferase family 2 [Brachyspira hyodysenteriae]KLI39083.1 glycosyl transferase family 2 [Brachyspira hyodysenteriae]KLI41761.1 glycosyl transferase family 2 [Brachyspira hyodysenteriae]KLI49900.1 glycosyl transferase family 2 [Brachyspira hyodysenteriae]
MLNVIVPVYNEKDNIKKLFDEIKNNIKVPISVFIIYDFDEDNTLEEVNKIKELYDFDINLLKNKYGRGVLNAIKTGLYLENNNPVLVIMADLSDSLEIVDNMYKKITEEGYDLVCGSRYMKGGRQIGGPFFKGLMSRTAGISLHILTGINTHDISNSFKMYSRKVLDSITIESNGGFELGMEITVKAYAMGCKIAEIPSTWRDRTSGESRFKLFSWLPKYLHWYFYALKNKRNSKS